MNAFLEDDGDTLISIHTEHGPLHALLTQRADACGLAVLAHAGTLPEAHDDALASALREAGMSTLVIDLLTHQEEHFADVHNNVPLLAKRLLECLTLIKRQMLNEELPTLPIALCAAGTVSPAIVRVAGLRDHDIAAVACRGGLIDLAGMLYLRSLKSPLLVLLGEFDGALLASNRRALDEVTCTKRLEIVAASDSSFASTTASETVIGKIVDWFGEHCRLAEQRKVDVQR